MSVSPRGAGDAPLCAWCRERPALPGGRFCHVRCRQAAHRARRRRTTPVLDGPATPGRFLVADPPYPGLARRYYRDEPSYAGEVDHRLLIARALTGGFMGWALCTSARALRDLLPLCPPEARVCAWVKPHGVSSRTHGPHNAWEPVIVVPGRLLRPGKRDWLRAQPARGGGTLMGRKPLAFCAWLFDLLGMLPGDELVDLFPGTGIVSRAWSEISTFAARAPGDVDAEELLRATASLGSAEASSDVVEDLNDVLDLEGKTRLVAHRDLKPENAIASRAPRGGA